MSTMKETKITLNSEGDIVKQEISEQYYSKDREPDYIKLYTTMWFDFYRFPMKYRELFIQLAIRMSYCNSNDIEHSQLVAVVGDIKDAIISACGWKTSDPLWKGLKSLCECGAIKKRSRGCYQINPSFAGKGSWKYNEKEKQGGIKDLIATFNFTEKSVDTNFVFYDNDKENIHERLIEDVNKSDIEDSIEDEILNEILNEIESDSEADIEE